MVHGRVCGLCALEITNTIHGVKRKTFQGEMAEQMRLDAIEWRGQHPKHAPKVAGHA